MNRRFPCYHREGSESEPTGSPGVTYRISKRETLLRPVTWEKGLNDGMVGGGLWGVSRWSSTRWVRLMGMNSQTATRSEVWRPASIYSGSRDFPPNLGSSAGHRTGSKTWSLSAVVPRSSRGSGASTDGVNPQGSLR